MYCIIYCHQYWSAFTPNNKKRISTNYNVGDGYLELHVCSITWFFFKVLFWRQISLDMFNILLNNYSKIHYKLYKSTVNWIGMLKTICVHPLPLWLALLFNKFALKYKVLEIGPLWSQKGHWYLTHTYSRLATTPSATLWHHVTAALSTSKYGRCGRNVS